MQPTNPSPQSTRPTEDALFECVSYYLENYDGRGVPKTIICQMHGILLPDDYDAGRYRQIEVKIAGAVITPPKTYEIAWKMRDALDALAAGLTDSNTGDEKRLAIVMFFHCFNAIHPFRDGNGRVSRAVLHLLLRQQGLLSAQNDFYDVFALRRDEYLEAMKEADLGNSHHLYWLISIGILDAAMKDFLDNERTKVIVPLLPHEDRRWADSTVRSQAAITDYFTQASAFLSACKAAIATLPKNP